LGEERAGKPIAQNGGGRFNGAESLDKQGRREIGVQYAKKTTSLIFAVKLVFTTRFCIYWGRSCERAGWWGKLEWNREKKDSSERSKEK